MAAAKWKPNVVELRVEMARRNFTQGDLAGKSYVSRGRINAILKGALVQERTGRAIAAALNRDFEALFVDSTTKAEAA